MKACSDSIKDIEASLGDLADAISITATGYRLTDSTNIDQALEIERELYGVMSATTTEYSNKLEQ